MMANTLTGYQLPILIELRRFSRSGKEDFLDFLETDKDLVFRFNRGPLIAYLTCGKAELIFDGLDEIFDATEREGVTRQIARFAETFPSVQMIVTSRLIGYPGRILRDAGFEHWLLADFDNDKVSSFLDHWLSNAIREPGDRPLIRKRMEAALRSPVVRELAGKQDSSIVDLVELANANPSVRGSINNIKDVRLPLLLKEKEICARYFFYSPSNACLAIEDPALFYYLKIADWEAIKRDCGFRPTAQEYRWDFAISFAGENRELAREIVEQLETLDISVFFDENYEANFLGKVWREQFRKIFTEESRFVVALLDQNHDRKIWPSFERECFSIRVRDGRVIPIFLDETVFVGISKDVIGIKFKPNDPINRNAITDSIIWKLHDRLAEPD